MRIAKDGSKILHVIMEEGDTLFITNENLNTVVKHNDIGISIDHYDNDDDDKEPFEENQVFFG